MTRKILLSRGVEGLFVKNTRFNTTLISFNFYLPLSTNDYAANTLLPYVLSSCCEEYKTYRELNTVLGKLYGATLSAGSAKLMNYQRISISVSVINDEYALDGECVVSRAAELLANLIFAPALQNGEFRAADVEREKRQMLDRIYGEINDKRGYTRNKATELLFGEDPYGIPKFGTAEAMQAVDGKMLFSAWERLLKEAFVRINVIGGNEETANSVFAAASAGFSAISRDNVTDISESGKSVFAPKCEVTERMDITQGKLAMAFVTDLAEQKENSAALSVTGDIFGGGPYSKLFMNVRERLSLCYYCACGIVKNKGFMLVDSGLEEKNAVRAREEIEGQLAAMQRGEVTDGELEASVRSICDSAKSVYDSQEGINAWYSSRITDSGFQTPTEFADAVKRVKKEDICRVARSFSLNTVYMLLPKEEK